MMNLVLKGKYYQNMMTRQKRRFNFSFPSSLYFLENIVFPEFCLKALRPQLKKHGLVHPICLSYPRFSFRELLLMQLEVSVLMQRRNLRR